MSIKLPDIKLEKDYDAKLSGINEQYEKLMAYWNTIKKRIIAHHESIKIESYKLNNSPNLEFCFNIFGLKCFMRFKYHLIDSRPGNSIIQYGAIHKNEETGKEVRVHIADVELDDNGSLVCPASEKGRMGIDDYGRVHAFILTTIMEHLAEAAHDVEEIEEIDILEEWEEWEGYKVMP